MYIYICIYIGCPTGEATNEIHHSLKLDQLSHLDNENDLRPSSHKSNHRSYELLSMLASFRDP